MGNKNMKCNDPKWIGYSNNELTVVGFVFKNKRWLWECRCSACGSITAVYPQHVIKGTQKSCHCGKARNAKKIATRHGERWTRLYTVWLRMRDRCNNPNNPRYNRYGGRGISVCDEWNDFRKFEEWAVQNGYSDELTIERVDINQGYCPNNCCWIPMKKQARNRSNNTFYKIGDEEKTLAEWCEIYKAPYYTVYSRIKKRGWDVERALTTPFLGKGANQTSYK